MDEDKKAFFPDVAERKRTARGAHNKRTHCGKSGRVMFPSDYMTKKEIEKMNGQVMTYRVNDPLPWKEYKRMPEDVRRVYIQSLREKYGAPDAKIAEMLDISAASMSYEMKRLGLRDGRNKDEIFDREGWNKWCGAAEKSETEEKKEKTQLSGSIKISGAIKDVADIMLQKIDKVVGNCEVTVTIEFGA